MEKFRSKAFNLILYPEDMTHYLAIDKIKKSYDYAMILHDRDLDENNELKKPHYHVVLRFSNAKWNTALASELEIAENYIQECHSLKRSLMYLIHYYDEDKAQYLIKEVQGSLKKKLEQEIKNNDKSESEKILEIFEEIDQCDYEIKFDLFFKHIASIGYWEVLRRSSSLVIKYVDEHNKRYYNGY